MTEQTIGPDRLVGVEIGGKYKIVRLLGEGGMGCVYQGEQKLGATIRKVAIKTLHEHLSHDAQILARFEREVGTVAGLQHPNTIQVFDFGKMDDGTLFIVMEFVEGKSVASILEQEGPMDPPRVANILKQVCGSLEEAHGLGIIHRDLKPDNIVLCDKAGQKDWVEVLDFGIAKRSSETDEREQKLTQQGMVLGTPPYMSPEQFTGKPVDRRSDIYSLAVMAYEMLTGGLPFTGNTAWEWATAHMTAQPRPIETYPVSYRIPPGMKAAIQRALAKDPNQRFPTVTDFFTAFSSTAAERVPTQPGAPLDPMAMGMAPGMAPPPQYPTGPQPAYGTPPQGSHTYTPQPFPQMMTPAPVAPPPKKSSAAGIVVAILALLLLLGGAAVAAVVYMNGKPASSTAAAGTTTASATATETATATATETTTASGNVEPLALDSSKSSLVSPPPHATATHTAAAPTHTAAPTQTATTTYTPAPTYTPTQPVYTAPPPTYTAPPANDPPVCQSARMAKQQRASRRIVNQLERLCRQQGGTP